MVDVKENDEALKSNSCPKADAAQIVLTPEIVTITSKDEGSPVVGLNIDQGDNTEKALPEGEINKADTVIDVVRDKDEEKTNEQINGEILGGSSKGKRKKPRKWNKKKKVAQKTSEMVVGNGNKASAIEVAKNGGEERNEDVIKEALTEKKNEEKKNMDKLSQNSNGKVKKPRRWNKKKKVAKRTSEMVANNGNEANAIVIANEDAVKEALTKKETEEKINMDKLGQGSNGRGRKPMRNKKKVAEMTSEMVVVDGDKPESSSKKKVESMGMVFMCSSKTKADCFRYKIFGLPAGKKDQVAKIYKGMRLFLYDVDLRLMYGVFKAVGAGGYHIEPKAFKSAFPSQVRFTVMEDCLPLAEEKFRTVIKENYYTRNKFECQLNAQQVKNLCKLFVAAKSGSSPKKAIEKRPLGADESHESRDKRKRRDWEEDRQPRPQLGREQRRYHDYKYGQPSVKYERVAVHPVARYLPPPQLDPTTVRSYGYETTYSYARDPVLDHRSYHVPEPEPRHYGEIVSHQLYSTEPPIYGDNVYPSVGQTGEYHHLPAAAAAWPSQYHLVSGEYPPAAVQPAEYHISGGLQARGYGDVGHTSNYISSAALIPEYRPLPTRYGY